MKKGLLILIAAIIVIRGLLVVAENIGSDHKEDRSGKGGSKATFGMLQAEQGLEFSSSMENLPEGFFKATSRVTSPLHATITINTVSRDSASVRGVWQDGKRTVIVIEPSSNKPINPQY